MRSIDLFRRVLQSGTKMKEAKEIGPKKETLWLGVEPRLPAFRQMCSIKLTSKCTNRYTTKDWWKPRQF
jgi:hypothetical protein